MVAEQRKTPGSGNPDEMNDFREKLNDFMGLVSLNISKARRAAHDAGTEYTKRIGDDAVQAIGLTLNALGEFDETLRPVQSRLKAGKKLPDQVLTSLAERFEQVRTQFALLSEEGKPFYDSQAHDCVSAAMEKVAQVLADRGAPVDLAPAFHTAEFQEPNASHAMTLEDVEKLKAFALVAQGAAEAVSAAAAGETKNPAPGKQLVSFGAPKTAPSHRAAMNATIQLLQQNMKLRERTGDVEMEVEMRIKPGEEELKALATQFARVRHAFARLDSEAQSFYPEDYRELGMSALRDAQDVFARIGVSVPEPIPTHGNIRRL